MLFLHFIQMLIYQEVNNMSLCTSEIDSLKSEAQQGYVQMSFNSVIKCLGLALQSISSCFSSPVAVLQGLYIEDRSPPMKILL